MAHPSSIDDVIALLGDIVDDAVSTGDRRGLFAALYRRTTVAVRDAIDEGRFDDAGRMEELDVLFAQRYFDAWDAHEEGSRPTRPWAYAFEMAADDRPSAVQHLLLGVNAHISLDLAISACATAPGDELPTLQRDFFEINRVLAAMVDEVQEDLNRSSAFLARIDRWGGPVDEALATYVLSRLRTAAWRKARRYATAPQETRGRFLERWERQVESTSKLICPAHEPAKRVGLQPGRLLARTIGGVDRRDVASLIAAIA